MKAPFNYYWRVIATGCCFATFGLGGLALSSVVFPVLSVIPGGRRAQGVQRVRNTICKSFGAFLRLMETLGIMHLDVVGADKLRQAKRVLVLANHPTLIDVVALVSLMPQASCVVKQALWRNPMLRGVVRAAGYISNSDSDRLIDDCASDLKSGHPLLIFPEGTRSCPGEPLHFLRGAAYIALRSGLPVLPVLIDCSPSTLTKRERWYHIPHRAFRLRIQVLEARDVSQWIDANDPPAIAARRLTQAFETYFTQELTQWTH